MNMINQTLDARGLNCPMPILKTKKVLSTMNSGEVLQVVTTDPGSVKDMGSFCRQTGHNLVSSQEENKEHIFVIRKS